MVVCGIHFAASEGRFVILESEQGEISHINVKTRRLLINNDENQDEIKAFRDTIFAFFRENHVQIVAIKKRNKKGDYAGGAISFKLEAITQLYDECPVNLISPQTIKATLRKYSNPYPTTIYEYQKEAFEVAFTAIKTICHQ